MLDMKIIRLLLAALALAVPVSAAHAQDAQTNLPRVRLAAGMHQIDAQVAQSIDERSTGLMYRRQMPLHEGMLFIFDQPSVQCFWMKNTVLPLTAAFVAADGTVVNLEDMRPMTTDSHCSAAVMRRRWRWPMRRAMRRR